MTRILLFGRWLNPVFVERKALPLSVKVKEIIEKRRQKFLNDKTVDGVIITPVLRNVHKNSTPGKLNRIASIPEIKGEELLIPVETNGTNYLQHMYASRAKELEWIEKEVKEEKTENFFNHLFEKLPITLDSRIITITSDNKLVTGMRSENVIAEALKHDSPSGYVWPGEKPVQAAIRKLEGEAGIKKDEIVFLEEELKKAVDQENPKIMVLHSRSNHGAVHNIFIARTSVSSSILKERQENLKDKKYVKNLRFTDCSEKGIDYLINKESNTIYPELYELFKKELNKSLGFNDNGGV
ncbi:MAG: NUDIX domain-containing protein [archaeon]